MTPEFHSEIVPLCDILIVDDDATLRSALSQYLERFGYVVRCAKNGRVAVEMLGRLEVKMVITDLFMPEYDGLELVFHLRKKLPKMEVLVITGDGLSDPEVFMKAVRQLGVRHVILKPFSLTEVLDVVKGAIGEVQPFLRGSVQGGT